MATLTSRLLQLISDLRGAPVATLRTLADSLGQIQLRIDTTNGRLQSLERATGYVSPTQVGYILDLLNTARLLRDVAPYDTEASVLRDPVSGKTVAELLAQGGAGAVIDYTGFLNSIIQRLDFINSAQSDILSATNNVGNAVTANSSILNSMVDILAAQSTLLQTIATCVCQVAENTDPGNGGGGNPPPGPPTFPSGWCQDFPIHAEFTTPVTLQPLAPQPSPYFAFDVTIPPTVGGIISGTSNGVGWFANDGIGPRQVCFATNVPAGVDMAFQVVRFTTETAPDTLNDAIVASLVTNLDVRIGQTLVELMPQEGDGRLNYYALRWFQSEVPSTPPNNPGVWVSFGAVG